MVKVKINSATPDLSKTAWNQQNKHWFEYLWRNFRVASTDVWVTGPGEKHGVLGGDKVKKTRKQRKYDENEVVPPGEYITEN